MKKSKVIVVLFCLLGIFICTTSITYANENPIFEKYEKSGLHAAEIEFHKTINITPKDDVPYASIIYLYIHENQHKKAINMCMIGLKAIPNSRILYNLLGTLYEDEGNTENALKAFDKSIELEPSEPAYFNRGRVYARNQQFDKAINDFTMAIKYSETNPDAYKERAMSRLAKGATNKNLTDEDRGDLVKFACIDLETALKQYRETNNVKGYQEVFEILEKISNVIRNINEE